MLQTVAAMTAEVTILVYGSSSCFAAAEAALAVVEADLAETTLACGSFSCFAAVVAASAEAAASKYLILYPKQQRVCNTPAVVFLL